MRRRREPIPRARRPWGWLAGLLTLGLLAGGTVAAALLLWENVDIQRLTRIPGETRRIVLPEPAAPSAPAVPAAGFEAVVYRSAASAGHFPDTGFYPDILTRWRAMLSEAGAAVRYVDGPAAVEALDGRGLVVAPSAVCLAQGEVDALRRHAERGGGLVLTWATGARDGSCTWRGWSVVADLTGALDVRELEQRDGLFLTVPAETALSAGVEPAARIELRWDAQLAVATPGARVYWSDWALNPHPAAGTEVVDAAATTRVLEGGGRIAWFGFLEHDGAGDLDAVRLRRLLVNGAHWAAGVPTAEIMPWPGGHRAAVMLSEAVSGEFANARLLSEAVRERGLPATWFAVSQLAGEHPELGGALRKSGEVGSQTSDNALLAGLPRAEQETRLRRSVSEIEEWTGTRPLGLRPPEEAADEATLAAWAALGGTYVVGLNGGRTGSPEVIPVDGADMVVLPRTIKDDYNLLVQDRVLQPGDLTSEMEEGLRKMRALGGLALLTLHTELAGTPRYIEPLADMLESHMQGGAWWIATGAEIAEWVRARSEAKVRLVRAGEERIELEVEAPSHRPLRGAWVSVGVPRGVRGWAEDGWAPEVDGEPTAYGESVRGMEIPIGDLGAGEVRRIQVTRMPDGDAEDATPEADGPTP